jgi:plastocyanin
MSKKPLTQPMNRRAGPRAWIACALAIVSLGGCGASSQPAGRRQPGGSQPQPAISSVLNLRALPSPAQRPYSFNTRHLVARAGRVQIRFTNGDPLAGHNVRIQSGTKCCFHAGYRDLGGTNFISKGSTTATVTLKPGRYTFLCSAQGHWQRRMHGTLVVT